MTWLTSRFYDRAPLAPIAAVLIIAASAASTHGAISAPLPSPNANPESKFQQDCWAAQNSLWLRNKVAKERYQQKLDRRASIIAGLKAELARKTRTVNIPNAPVRAPRHEVDTVDGVTDTLVWIMLALAGVLPVWYFWSRHPARRRLLAARRGGARGKHPYPVRVLTPTVVRVRTTVIPQVRSSPPAAVRPGRGASGTPPRQGERRVVWALS
jgi:hypothetical protein